ncbi:MAG: hypothetical protein ACRENE_04235, partial [Polyangiaceae bacterium]
MTELRDGEELSIEVPDGVETCLAYPPNAGAAAAACKSVDATILATVLAPSAGRLVAAGAVRVDGVPAPLRFAVSFAPDSSAVEPTADTAREFAAREVALRTSAPAPNEGGTPGAGSVDILAVGGSPPAAAPTSGIVTAGGSRCVRATYTLDLRESGHDVPLHFATYGAWSRDGVYTFTVQGDALHAAAADSLADDAARTLMLKA